MINIKLLEELQEMTIAQRTNYLIALEKYLEIIKRLNRAKLQR